MSQTSPALTTAQTSALAMLMSRQSRWPLVAPAPTEAQLHRVLDAAVRAPDHGRLQPWRFVLIRDAQRAALGDVFVAAARARDAEGDAERFRVKAMAAPLIIALVAHLQPGHKVPESEQLLAVGAATMNMLNALHILGYGGFWATGLNSRDAHVQQALGLSDTEQLLGFLYVGTPKERWRPVERAKGKRFARDWVPQPVDAVC